MSAVLRKMLGQRGLLMDVETGGEGSGGGGGEDAAAAAEVAAAAEAAAAAAQSKISDSEAKLLKEVMDKKNALKKANADLEVAASKLKEFEGLDAKEIRALIQQKKDAENQQLEAKGEWDRLKAQMAEEHTREKGALKEQYTSAQAENLTLKQQIAELTVGSAFAQSQFIATELALASNKARVVYGPHFETVDGQVIAYDKPAGAAARTMLVDAQGEALGFEAALRKIVDADPDRESLMRSKIKQGAGSKTATKTGAATVSSDSLVGKDRIAASLAKSGLLQNNNM